MLHEEAMRREALPERSRFLGCRTCKVLVETYQVLVWYLRIFVDSSSRVQSCLVDSSARKVMLPTSIKNQSYKGSKRFPKQVFPR